METMKQSGPWSSLGSDGSLVPVVLCGGYVFPAAGLNEILTFKVRFDLEGQGQLFLKTIGILTKVLCTSGPNLLILAWMADELWCGQAPKMCKFGLLSSIWHWRSRSIAPKNNRDLNQAVLHLLSKFGVSSLNRWRFMARTSSGLTDTHIDSHTHTDRQTQATTIPEGQNWPRVKNYCYISHSPMSQVFYNSQLLFPTHLQAPDKFLP